ncbi:fused MFS/spermidine synthase [Bordetella petrii]|uniref:fused MFS/spermidine synthase n=1 Tax=Bordetella petrii TaxID=94624 RepID=UPI001A962937|nr:fused MFS/spermidine synthase [Bordetella petrii]MBO1113858.1 fused MFS/spermidine synthase [Bordetella petrii]
MSLSTRVPVHVPDASERSLGLIAPSVLLALSGAAALVFQIIWIKQLSLIVGVEVHAIAMAVSAFFLGLALGGWWLGRKADRARRPLRLYAQIEAGIAIVALFVTQVLAHGAWVFARGELHSPLLAWLAVFVVIGAAPFLMGGTLPILLRAAGAGRVGRAGAALYAANTAGAVAGALLPAFVLIPALGVQASASVAASLNLAAALGAWMLDRRHRAFGVGPVPADAGESCPLPARTWLAIGLYTAAGAVALGYEVLWSQMIVPFMSTRAFAFSIVLAVYLAGLAIGSALYARWEHRLGDPWRVFGLLIACAGVFALLEAAVLGRWLVSAQSLAEAAVRSWTNNGLAGMSARFTIAAGSIVLLPTLLLGAAFPAVLRIAVPPERRGQGAGAVLASNTLGGIVGTAITAFVLLPYLGTVRSLVLLALIACGVGSIAVWQARPAAPMGRVLTIALGGAVLIIGWALPVDHLARLLPGAQGGNLLFYEENHGGTVAVVESGRGDHRFRRLYIQGVSNSGDAMPSLRYMRLQALLPLIVHAGEPRSALVIGYGTGITAGALSRYPGLERRVVAELLPGVLHAAALFKGTYGALQDPGLDVRLRDGRRELLASDERYDLITLEPPPPSAAGVVNLYSRDFYALAATRLNAHGIVAQWLPLPTQNLDDTRALVASFIAVFPHASLWTTELHEMLMVGSRDPLPLNAASIGGRYAQPTVRAALAEVGIASPAALLATWVTDRGGLARFAGETRAVTDDFPAIEYASWVRPREVARTLPELLALRGDPPVQGGDAALLADIARERARLDLFYRSALAAYRGDREGWARDAAALAQAGQGNAYLRWFIGSQGE